VVEPDLLFVANDQVDILTPKNIQGSPALVVEVLSDGTRKVDAQIKRRLFERMAVREYWLIDPTLDTVQIFRTSGRRMPKVAELTMEDGDVHTTELLPGFSLPLREFFQQEL
jgi:Uma2 family endonuclease